MLKYYDSLREEIEIYGLTEERKAIQELRCRQFYLWVVEDEGFLWLKTARGKQALVERPPLKNWYERTRHKP